MKKKDIITIIVFGDYRVGTEVKSLRSQKLLG